MHHPLLSGSATLIPPHACIHTSHLDIRPSMCAYMHTYMHIHASTCMRTHVCRGGADGDKEGNQTVYYHYATHGEKTRDYMWWAHMHAYMHVHMHIRTYMHTARRRVTTCGGQRHYPARARAHAHAHPYIVLTCTCTCACACAHAHPYMAFMHVHACAGGWGRSWYAVSRG